MSPWRFSLPGIQIRKRFNRGDRREAQRRCYFFAFHGAPGGFFPLNSDPGGV